MRLNEIVWEDLDIHKVSQYLIGSDGVQYFIASFHNTQETWLCTKYGHPDTDVRTSSPLEVACWLEDKEPET